jgi:O-antigen ligase
MILIKREIHNKVYLFLFPALAFVIPLHDRLVPPVIALIGLNWLIEFTFADKFYHFRNQNLKKYFLPQVSLYLIYGLGILYSSQITGKSGALFDMEVKLSLFLFPLFFTTIDLSGLGISFFSKVLKAYVYGCLISSIILINFAVLHYFQKNDSSVFFYKNLSMSHHPSYIALFFTFAIAILLIWLIKREHKNAFKRNVVLLLILHFELLIVLLSSKAGILGLGFTCLIIVIYFLSREKRKLRMAIVYSLLTIAALGILLSLFPAALNRFYTAKKSIEDNQIPDNQKAEGSVSRLLVWKTSIQLIKENFIFGVGTGDVKTELFKKYKEKSIDQALKDHLNSHNQYLQTFVAIGSIGFILLFLSLLIPIIYGMRKRKVLLVLFVVVFAFHLLVESMLERQAGVVFFAFFTGLLIFSGFPENDESISQLPKI